LENGLSPEKPHSLRAWIGWMQEALKAFYSHFVGGSCPVEKAATDNFQTHATRTPSPVTSQEGFGVK